MRFPRQRRTFCLLMCTVRQHWENRMLRLRRAAIAATAATAMLSCTATAQAAETVFGVTAG